MAGDAATTPEEEPGFSLGQMGVDEVRSRAASGAALLGARGALIYLFGIGANLLLARLLVPRDFGLVALGTVILVFGGYLVEGGLGAALIRRAEPPKRRELEAVLGLQLGALTVLAAAAAAIGAAFGRDGLVVATMVASLPIATLRTPSVIVLERRLRYGVIATADIVEALTYYAWAVASVAAGFGVWGMATAVVVRAFSGTAIVIARGPLGLTRPRWSWSAVRPIVGFGAKVQLTSALYILREQGLNVVVAAVAGLATLGVWNLAWRVIQIPNLIFANVGRVAFPAMSRLLGAGEELRAVLERAVAALAVLTGVVVVGLVGLSPSLPTLIGESWSDVPAVLLWSCVALTIAAPVVVTASGYLLAAGAAGAVALATLLSGIVWFLVAVLLLPRYGAPAVGIGWVAGASLNIAILGWRTVVRTGAELFGRAAPPALVTLTAIAAGWLAGNRYDNGLAGGAVGFVVGEALLVAGLALTSRAGVRDTRAIARQALGTLRGGNAAAATQRP